MLVMNIGVFCGDDERSYYVYDLEILKEENQKKFPSVAGSGLF